VTHSANEPIQNAAVILAAWRDFRRHWSSLVVFEAAFKLLEAWLLAPLIAVALAVVMSRAGHVALSDWDILDFLLTPFGLMYVGLFGTFTAASMLFQQAGVMTLVARTEDRGKPSSASLLVSVVSLAWRVIQLGAIKLGLLVLTSVPFVVLLGLTYFVFLSKHDINFYLAERPPVYWLAVGMGAMVTLAAGVVGLMLAIRWSFALPILLFEQASPRDALQGSAARVVGIRWRIAGLLLGWQFGILLLGTGLNAGFQLIATRLPEGVTENPRILMLLLILRGVLLAGISAAATLGHALFIRQLYLVRGAQLGMSSASSPDFESTQPASVPVRMRRQVFVALAVLVCLPIVVWAGLSQRDLTRPKVQVTAHRGHARLAPENTRSAIQAAIHSGADYAEIDVELTADGQIVLLHDRDLKRVTGDSRRIENVTYAELQKLDAGSWFSSNFAEERIPTLLEIIDLSRGQIKLNIELKTSGSDPRLAREVSRILRETKFENDCIVTSFNHNALLDVRRSNPNIRTGIIIATAVGDVTRLESEVLSIRADWLTDTLLRSARRRGLEVHVWTVNDERQMVRLMMRGVDNILTSDPDLLIHVRQQWSNLTDAEELVLASRILLGLE